MAVEMFSWPSLHERMCRTWESNSGLLDCQADTLPIELPHLASVAEQADESYPIAHLEDRFSRDVAHVSLIYLQGIGGFVLRRGDVVQLVTKETKSGLVKVKLENSTAVGLVPLDHLQPI